MKYALYRDSRVGARPYNQDRLVFDATPESLLLVVADGMGGHAHGEVAAKIVTDYIAAAFRRDARAKLADPDLFLFRAVGRAHQQLYEQAARLGLAETPRTTVVAAVVQDGQAWWSHVGDSRFYLVRGARVVARSRDHTLVQQLVDAGRIREEAVSTHPERNKLLQCLGGGMPPKLEPAQSARLVRDDVLLLCSDGFWGPLTQRQLLTGLLGRPLERALPELMGLAERRAGPGCDNLTVLALAWQEDAVEAPGGPRSVPTIPFHELPTDVQDFTATDPNFPALSDEEIERQIAEIRAVLAKHAPKREP